MKKHFILFCFVSICSIIPAQRVVLIEQFTNSGCPPCAASTPPVFNYVNNNLADVVAIGYHTSYPYSDSMYFENPVESNARVAYYGSFGVPQSFVDGNYYSNSSSNFIPVMANTINTRKAIANKYNISNANTTITGNNLNTQIIFESLSASNVNDTLRAHIVVIEKNVLKSSYAASPGANSETNYEYVMRKMLPNQVGSFLINRSLNGKDTIAFNWAMQKIKNNTEVRVVAFVQNKNTKEVYMANMFSTNLSTGVTENNNELYSFQAYADPRFKTIRVTADKIKNTANIVIIDMSGKKVASENILPGETILMSTSSFNAGIYLISLNDGINLKSKKIIVE